MGISLMTEASLDDEGCQAILSVSSHVMEASLRMLKKAPPGHGEVTEEVQEWHHQGPEGGMGHRGQ